MSYDTYQTVDRENIAKLKHKDIRVLQQGDITIARNLANLNTLTMGDLDLLTMGQLEGTMTLRKGEAWTAGTVASDPTRSNLKILSLTLAAGLNTTTSVVTDIPVDILTNFADTDSVSIALPSFPLSVVDQANSFLDLTSNSTGDFTTGPTASVALNASTVALISGNSEFRVLRSSFNQNNIDLSKVTGVRLRINATGAGTLRVAAIRLLPSTWIQGANGVDTRYGRLRKGIARNGDSASAGFTWPILWRASEPSGPTDPRPIDGEFAVILNTGSFSLSNQVTIYMRELTEDFLTQLDLNGLTMAELNGRDQPDIGTAAYNSRTQRDLQAFNQGTLDGEHQFDLERKPDFLSASWINFTFAWSPGVSSVTIQNTESGGSPGSGTYNFPVTGLVANTNYIFYATLEENIAQATIYQLDSSFRVSTLVFNSTAIIDDGAFRRRKGRFGWFAQLQDGDAFLDSITARKMIYAEYRSLPFESNTPVVGAELFTSGSPNIEHFSIFGSGPYNTVDTTINRDSNRATSGSSYRIDTLGSAPSQGIQSNYFQMADFSETEIQFDLWYPSEIISVPLVCYLSDTAGRLISLPLPKISPDQWQRIRLIPPYGQSVIAGVYQLILIQSSPAASSWWVDSPTIFSRSLIWEGRSVVDDPWQSNDARWVPFKNILNKENGGIMFTRRGNQLQVRARATRQDGIISRVQFKPKYAELGRFKDPSVTVSRVLPTANFSSAPVTGHTVRFTGTSTDSDGFIISHEWNFGDGTASIGNIVDHTYAAAGTYTVTVTAMDNNGNRNIFSNSVIVT